MNTSLFIQLAFLSENALHMLPMKISGGLLKTFDGCHHFQIFESGVVHKREYCLRGFGHNAHVYLRN